MAIVVLTVGGIGGSSWSMSIVMGVMMFAYVAVPSRLIGLKTTYSKRDKLSATAVGGPSARSCAATLRCWAGWHLHARIPPPLFVPGIFLLTLASPLQAGATGAVKAIKMSAKLVAGHRIDD